MEHSYVLGVPTLICQPLKRKRKWFGQQNGLASKNSRGIALWDMQTVANYRQVLNCSFIARRREC